ncbi:hypothetical protein [Streptomyces tropicalis]|uniref:Zinc-finger domain-containing protein n=1 Tax=Streptomyces tropicalis TaxID=3034234 RepID=A0ABT6A6M4_9ACTN|nr:hypothetical protein [Streptomyces tropicalis]MDF3300295.1 hypothetical protein [Streptomyces tropicalis]
MPSQEEELLETRRAEYERHLASCGQCGATGARCASAKLLLRLYNNAGRATGAAGAPRPTATGPATARFGGAPVVPAAPAVREENWRAFGH